MVVEEETVLRVERSNGLHVLGIKLKVEEVEVLCHALLVRALRYDDEMD